MTTMTNELALAQAAQREVAESFEDMLAVIASLPQGSANVAVELGEVQAAERLAASAVEQADVGLALAAATVAGAAVARARVWAAVR